MLLVLLGPPELRHGRSGKKLVVLTGYGKLNDGRAKIKPAVLQWLENCGYEYVLGIEFTAIFYEVLTL